MEQSSSPSAKRPRRRRRGRKKGSATGEPSAKPPTSGAFSGASRRRRRTSQGLPTVTRWVTTLFILCAPQVLGGAPPWATTVIAVSGLVALLVALAQGARWAPSGVTWAVLGVLGFTALQRIPLPAALVAWVSPRRASEIRASYELIDGTAPTWIPLTFDPGATSLALLTGVAIASAWLLGSSVTRAGRYIWAAQVSAASALLMVGVGGPAYARGQ